MNGLQEDEDFNESAIRFVGWLIVLVLLAGAVFITCAALWGCAPPTPAQAADAYTAEQEACLPRPTHAERVACIEAVRARWARDGAQ